MAPHKIMLIRHAEKPDAMASVSGVDENGTPSSHDLSVRGWQRAGALIRYFSPLGTSPPDGIAAPTALFACKPQNGANSVRPISTISPLARAMGLPIHAEFCKSDEAAFLNAIRLTLGAVLICWSHEPIPGIARSLAGDLPAIPAKWPGKRFDLVWVLDRAGNVWQFREVGQMLLPGDLSPRG